MKVAATAADEDLPDVATLLREGSFQQRMEAARKQRERVLAMRAAEADDQSDLVVMHKPWGRQGWEAPSSRRPDELPAAKDVFPALNDEGKTAGGVASPLATITAPEAPALQSDGARRSGFAIVRTSWGFALGLGLGLAVATAVPYLRSQNVPPETADQPASAQPAPTAGANVSPTVESAVRSDPPQDESAVIIVPDQDAVAQSLAPVFEVPATTDNAPAPDTTTEPILGGLSNWLPQSPVGAAREVGEQGLMLPPEDKPLSARAAPFMPDILLTADLPLEEPLSPPVVSAVTGPDFSSASIHILLSKGVSAGDASPLAAKLGGAGFSVTETAETGVSIRETNIRYYHLADADAAQALAAHLGVTARDFTGTSPAPPQGMIEVWVKGPKADKAPATEVKKAKAKAKKKAAAPAVDPAVAEAQELQALRDRLLKQLQAGASP